VIEEIARMAGLEVQEREAGFVEELAGFPLAQKRTSKNKAFVHVGKDAIFKGPYAAQSLKLINNLRYPWLIHLLEEMLGLPLASRGVYRWNMLHVCPASEERVYYVGGENVGAPQRMQVESASTQVDAACRVVVRETLLRRVSEIEKVKVGSRYERHPDFDEQVAVASLQHLYLRFLFNIGDSGTHNILVREDRATSGRPIAGIDFDEHRREQEGRTLWDCFFKSEYTYLEDIYGPLVNRIVLMEGLAPSVQGRIDELNTLCERWAECLPATRRSEGVVRVPSLLDRTERIRALIKERRGVRS